MKKILLCLLLLPVSLYSIAQTEKKEPAQNTKKWLFFKKQSASPAANSKVNRTFETKRDWSKVDLSNRAADHFMIQYGSDTWLNRPDSVRLGSGFSRHFNLYFMLDKPFKTNKKLSVAFGIGVGSSHIFFDRSRVDVKANSVRLPFNRSDSADNFKKYKVTNIYAEVPVEIRYFSNPENPNKSWKAALGLKVGTLLKTYSKGKNLVTKNGFSVYGPTYVEKESQRRFFNGTMLALTGRIGYGVVSLTGAYQITGVLKDGAGPAMNRLSIGITVSGL